MVAKKTSKPAKKPAAAKKSAAKKAPAKKASTKKAAKAKTTDKSTPAAKPKEPKTGSGVRSTDVVLAHLFALRPRVATSFKPDDFRQAKQFLEEESYANVQEAARAVAEKALDLTGSGLPKRTKRR